MRRLHRLLAVAVSVPALAASLAVPGMDAAAATSDQDGGTSPAERLADRLETGPLEEIREHRPSARDRYTLANGCFALYAPSVGQYVARDGEQSLVTNPSRAQAEPMRFQAFDLGKYLLFGSQSDFLALAGGPLEAVEETSAPVVDRAPIRPGTDAPRSIIDDAPAGARLPGTEALPDTTSGIIVFDAAPSARAEWIVRAAPGGGFTFHMPVDDGAPDDPGPADVAGEAPTYGALQVTDDGALTIDNEPSVFQPRPATGCASWPEVEVNVSGTAPTPDNPVDEARGYVDGHLHMMAFEFIGGRSRCGRPWHPYGVAYALVDCPDHEPGGAGAVLEAVLSGAPTHDTAGWPDFPYWPKYDSLTHEQVYYKWMERAWRGGLRMFTNLLVDNNALCEAWVYKENSCNEMDGVRLQAQRLRELERFVDAQWGGPGKGWFRIVTDPFEARRVINEGRLAVVMGIEISVLFDCGLLYGQPLCDEAQIDDELAAVHELGVRQMEFVNKFDNALSGVTGDGGSTGVVVNQGNLSDTGQYWQFETCPEDRHQHKHDRQQPNVVDDDPSGQSGQLFGRDAIFGAVLQVSGTAGAAPVYPQGPHCNVRGLTELGEHALDRMVERGMLFDPDHMSTRGRDAALTYLDQTYDYSGIISSHSWADDTVYEKVLEMGGVVTPYAGDSSGFVQKYLDTRSWADERYLFGIGYGADTNGFGSQGAPRNPEPGQGVSYPFEGFGGVRVSPQVSGNQTYDINTDGVDHYGLYPDWVEDIRLQLGAQGEQFLADMARGPEAYLQMWERALGIENNACRDDSVAPPTRAEIRGLRPGTPAIDVLTKLGQPHDRIGGVYTYCTTSGGAQVHFASDGTVARTELGQIGRPATAPGRSGDTPAAGRRQDGRGDEPGRRPHEHAGHELALQQASTDGAGQGGDAARITLLLLGLSALASALLRRQLTSRQRTPVHDDAAPGLSPGGAGS